MKLLARPRSERGHFEHGWLTTWHTFSFGDYYDPSWTQFRTLRVMNEDVISPDTGFGTHGHRDMEILTWVLSGELEHRDSLGNGGILKPGEMQWMSAGSGIRHSEFNPSASSPTHLYQIWLIPDRTGYHPTYDQKKFPEEGRRNRWQTLAAADGRDAAFPIRQDAVVAVAQLDAQEELTTRLDHGRAGWLQVLRGAVKFNGEHFLQAGDGVGLLDAEESNIQAMENAELLFFDLI